jgi:hypothetical protein
MNEKNSFDSENYFSECDFEEVETKEQTNIKEKEDEHDKKVFPNIDLIKTISQILETIVKENKLLSNYKEIVKKQNKMVFSANTIPNISIEDYLIRIQTYANMEKNTLITSLIYIDRLCKTKKLTLTYYNIHRILFTAILISIKYNEDCFYDNKFYAEIAGVKIKELKNLEYNFVNMNKFCFYVSDEIFEKYKQYLEQ